MAYARTIHLDLPYDMALEQTREALAAEGFGIPAEIDTQAVFKNKLGLDSDRRIILGACQPKVAFEALQIDPEIATLLPCNVVVHEISGGTDISIIKPTSLLALSTGLPLEAAEAVEDSLMRVLDRLQRSNQP